MNATNFTNAMPRTMAGFLGELQVALKGSDPAMIQDALFDSEEYLRAAIADNAALSESEVMDKMANEYGTPSEVAANYRVTDATVQAAIAPPVVRKPAKEKGWLARLFGVFVDPHAYGSLFYMLLSMWTGIFYFTYVVTGASLSVSMIILIIGLPLLILFLGSVRILALVEGRIVETLLGVRMPRRPIVPVRREGRRWVEVIKEFFTDPRTWSTMLYLLLMLPLGIVYFTVAVVLLVAGVTFLLSPIAAIFGEVSLDGVNWFMNDVQITGSQMEPYAAWVIAPLLFIAGVVILLALMHLARAIGKVHGAMAKELLVRW